MSKTTAQWALLDVNSLEDDGSDNVRVKVVAAGAIERTAAGLNIKTAGIINDMLAGNIAFAKLDAAAQAKIAELDAAQVITGQWDFPDAGTANAPTMDGTPTADNQLANKAYVDLVLQGLHPKDSAKLMSNTNIDPTVAWPGGNIDGVAALDGDRVFLQNNTNAAENGLWIISTSGAWSRPADFANGASASMSYFWVDQGTNYKDTAWICTTDAGSDVIDTDTLAFSQFGGVGTYIWGNGLDNTGNTVNVLPTELVSGGDAQIDGDTLDVTYVPTNYTRSTTPAEVTSAVELTAHLAGIDNALGTLSSAGTVHTEEFTLDATAVNINKYVTVSNVIPLAQRPNTRMYIKNAPNQTYAVDYQVNATNADRVEWGTLGLDGELAIGNQVTIVYYT